MYSHRRFLFPLGTATLQAEQEHGARTSRIRLPGSLKAAFLLLLLLGLLSLLPSSQAAAEDREGGGRDGEEDLPLWSVFIYMAADNNLEQAGILDINEMEKIGSTDDVQIIVQVDRTPHSNENNGYDSSNGDWTDTRRYLILKDTEHDYKDDPNNTIVSQRLDESEPLGELSMNQPGVLVDFLEWAVANYPAQHYAVDLWDHGRGTNGGVLNDDGTYMTLPLMEEAFEELKQGGYHFDLVTYDACLMGGIENYYNTIPITDVVASSEKLVPFYGYPYHTILDELVKDPEMNGSALASRFVKEYVWYYKPTGSISITQSAVNTSLLLDFVPLFDSWTELLMDYFPYYETEIREARNGSEEYDHSEMLYNYVDLYHFIERTNLTINTLEFDDLSTRVLLALETCVIEESHHTNSNKHQGKDRAENAHGFTIYFPHNSKDSYYNSYAEIKFARDTQWLNFLDLYFAFKDSDYRANHQPGVEFATDALAIGTNEQGQNDSFVFSSALEMINDKNLRKVQLRYLVRDRFQNQAASGNTSYFSHNEAGNQTLNFEIPEDDFSLYFLYVYLYDEDDCFLDYRVLEAPLEFVSVGLKLESPGNRVEPGGILSYTLTVSNTGNSRKVFDFTTSALLINWNLNFEKDILVLDPGQSETLLGNLSVPGNYPESDQPSTFIITVKCTSNNSVYASQDVTVFVGLEKDEEGEDYIQMLIIGGAALGVLLLVLFLLSRKKKTKEEDLGPAVLSTQTESAPEKQTTDPAKLPTGGGMPELPTDEPTHAPTLESKIRAPGASDGGGGFNLGGDKIAAPASTGGGGGFNLGGDKIAAPASTEGGGGFNLGGDKIAAPASTEGGGGFNLGGDKIAAPASTGGGGGFNLGGDKIAAPASTEGGGGFNLGGDKIAGPASEGGGGGFNLGGDKIAGPKEEEEPAQSFNLGGDKIAAPASDGGGSFNLGGEHIKGPKKKKD